MYQFVIIFFLMVSVASADDVVFYDKGTKEILFIEDSKHVNLSAEDKARVEVAPAPKNFDKNGLTRPVSDYKFSGGKVVLNTKKIADAEDLQVAELQKFEKEMIDRKSGIEKLKATGLTNDEIEALFK